MNSHLRPQNQKPFALFDPVILDNDPNLLHAVNRISGLGTPETTTIVTACGIKTSAAQCHFISTQPAPPCLSCGTQVHAFIDSKTHTVQSEVLRLLKEIDDLKEKFIFWPR